MPQPLQGKPSSRESSPRCNGESSRRTQPPGQSSKRTGNASLRLLRISTGLWRESVLPLDPAPLLRCSLEPRPQPLNQKTLCPSLSQTSSMPPEAPFNHSSEDPAQLRLPLSLPRSEPWGQWSRLFSGEQCPAQWSRSPLLRCCRVVLIAESLNSFWSVQLVRVVAALVVQLWLDLGSLRDGRGRKSKLWFDTSAPVRLQPSLVRRLRAWRLLQ